MRGRGGVYRERMDASLCWAMVQFRILSNCTKLYPHPVLEYSDCIIIGY